MDDLSVKLKDVIQDHLSSFFVRASKIFNIDKSKLEAVYYETDKKKGVAKKSSYQLFFSKKRLELKKEDDSIGFGDLSKKISAIWNNMTKEQQQVWVQENYPVDPDQEQIGLEIKKEDYENMKVSELRVLCEQKGLRKNGNKTELIKNLTSSSKTFTKNEPPSVLGKGKILPVVVDDSVHITENIGSKRTSIEEEIIPDNHEEDDFIFDEVEDSEEEDLSSENDFDEGEEGV